MSLLSIKNAIGTILNLNTNGDGTASQPIISPIHAYGNIAGVLRAAETRNLGGHTQWKRRDDVFFDTETIGTGAAVYENANGGVKMSVSANLDCVIRQSKRSHQYFAGNVQTFDNTFIDLTPVTNVIKRVGLFSSSTTTPFSANLDGFCLETDDTAIYAKVYKDGATIFSAAQSGWDDPLDGTGRSGITLAPANFNAAICEFLYLGGTAARFGFIIGGSPVWVHTFENANVNASTFVLSPNQPLRWEIRSTGGTADLYHVCGRVGSIGTTNISPSETHYKFNNGDFINANTVNLTYALHGVKLNTRHAVVRFHAFKARALTADDFVIKIIKNPTIAGTAPTFNAATGLSYSTAIADTVGNPSVNTVTGGDLIYQEEFSSTSESVSLPVDNILMLLGQSIAGVFDEYWLCVEPLGANLDIRAEIDIDELV